MSNIKLYNHIIKNAATKKTKNVKVTILVLILAVKECNMTKLIKLLCSPLLKCNLIYFMFLASLYTCALHSFI